MTCLAPMPVAQFRADLHEVHVLQPVEQHPVVDVVGDDPRVGILHQHVGQRDDLVPAVDHAGGIGRVVEQEHLRLVRGQGLVQLRRGELVVLRCRARQGDRLGVHDIGDVEVGGPVRCREGNHVAFVQQGLGQVVDHVLGADAGGAIRAAVTGQADRLHVRDEGIEQRIGTAIAAVLAAVLG